MSNPQTVHLIYGPTAAGKSTYARRLATDGKAIRFAIDDWMHTLFSQDKPDSMNMEWVMSRVRRCQVMIWSTCLQVLSTGTDVVLEFGLLREQDRDRMQSMVDAAGHKASFQFVDACLQIRRQRVLQRNVEKGETYSFEVTPAMFDAMERYFERPSSRELGRSLVISEGQNHE